jgi:hypothetical protein
MMRVTTFKKALSTVTNTIKSAVTDNITNSNNTNIITKSISYTKMPNSKQLAAIEEVLQERFRDKCQGMLSRQEFREAELKIGKSLLDLNSFLQSNTSIASAQRQQQLTALSTLLQQTLDSVRDRLSDLRGEIQSTGNRVLTNTRQQRLEAELQRREGAFGVALGEFRTKAEAVKLRAIYAFTMGIAGLFLAIVIETNRKRNNHRIKPPVNSINDASGFQ